MRVHQYAFIRRAVDGDTFEIVLDLGFDITLVVYIRIKGVNTAELHDVDPIKKKLAEDERDFARTFEGKKCQVNVYRKERYGRWESDLIVDRTSYADLLKAKFPDAIVPFGAEYD